MNDREKFKALLPVITAFSNGETIQFRDAHGQWHDFDVPIFADDPQFYRIKPKPPAPKYREYTTEEMKSLVGKKVECKNQGWYLVTGCESDGEITVNGNWVFYSRQLLADGWTIDGKPCGVEVTQ